MESNRSNVSAGVISNRPHQRPVLNGREILLVEDCVDQGRLYLKFLKLAGAEVTLECNGKAAVETGTKQIDRFDAIVMDFQMPVLDGLQSTQQLRAAGYCGKIVAATSYGDRELQQRWFAAGCDDYLVKPLLKTQLVDTLVAQLDGADCPV